MKPLHDKVFVKPLEDNEKSHGGIIIHGKDEFKRKLGIVLDVGEGYYTDKGIKPLVVKEGEKVSYIDSNQVHEQEVDGESILVMSEQNILYVIED